MYWQSIRTPFFIGLIVGLAFGCADLALTWLDPVEDDSPLVLLRFYGPMLLVWSVVAFNAARRAGRVRAAVGAGMIVAFATFAVFVVLNFLRVNLFLNELTERADWQSLMMRFRASGAEHLREFVNLDYLRGTPFKIVAATMIGALCGAFGGVLGCLVRARTETRTV